MARVNLPDGCIGAFMGTASPYTTNTNINYSNEDTIICNPSSNIDLTLNTSSSALMKSGRTFMVINIGSSTVTLKSNGGGTIFVLLPGYVILSCLTDNPQLATDWNYALSQSDYQLKSDQLLNSDYFPNTTGLYAVHNNGISDFDGTAWTGVINATEIGAFTSGTNHLGLTAYCISAGAAAFYLPSVPSGSNKNFSVGAWIKVDSIATNKIICTRYSSTNSEKSFSFYIDTDKTMRLLTFYDASGNSVITKFDATGIINDGKWHYASCAYKYVSGSEAYKVILLDGVVRAYDKLTSNTARNDDGGAEICFGGLDTGDADSPSLSDCWFKQDTTYGYLEPNELRKIYAAGCRKFATVDGNGIVKIDGKASVKIKIAPVAVSIAAASTPCDVTGWSLFIPENGIYDISINAAIQASNLSGGSGFAQSSTMAIKNNTLGTVIWQPTGYPTAGIYNSTPSTNQNTSSMCNDTTKFNYLTINDNIILRANSSTTASTGFDVSVGEFTICKD